MAITIAATVSHNIAGAGPLILPSLSWQAGDVIAVSTSHSNSGGAASTITPSVAGLTFVLAGQGGPDGAGWWSGRVGALHYAVAGASGSGAISVAASASGYPMVASAFALRGADTANPLRGAFAKSDGWDVSSSLLTLTTEPGDMVIGAFAYNDHTTVATPTGGQVIDRSASDATSWGLTYHATATGSSVASGWSRGASGGQWRHVAAVFRAATGGGAANWTPATPADDFQIDGAPDGAKWTIQSFNASASTTGATAANVEGQARMTLPANAAAATVIGYTSPAVDLRNKLVYTRLDGFSQPTATGVEAYLQVGHDGSNRLRAAAQAGSGGTFTAATILAGTGTTVQSATYAAATHRWIGIGHRQSDNTAHFLFAADDPADAGQPGAWTTFHTMAWPSQVDPASCKFAIEGRTAASVATPGHVAFGSVNTRAAAAAAPTSITWDPTDAADTPTAIEASIGTPETVVIEDQSGNPVAGVAVTSGDAAVFTVSPATTGADGLVTITPVAPGAADLVGAKSGLTSAVASVTVPTEGSGGGEIPTAVPPTITSTSPLPAVTVGTNSTVSIAVDGDGPFTLDVTAGALPAGLALPSGMPLASPLLLPWTGNTGAGTTASFTLRATGPDGAQDSRAFELSIQAAAPQSPTAPGTVTVDTITADGATVRWQDLASTETGYIVRYRPVNGSTYQTATAAANATSRAITGLLAGTQYEGGVAAQGSPQDSAYVAFAPFTTTAPIQQPTVTGVTFSPTSPQTLANGASLQVTPTVVGTGEPSQSGTWSKVSGVGTVTQTGNVATIAGGTTAGAGKARFAPTDGAGQTFDFDYTVQAAAPVNNRTATITGLTRTPAGSSAPVVAANMSGIRCAIVDATWPAVGTQTYTLLTIATDAQGNASLTGLPSTVPASAGAVLRTADGNYAAFVPITTAAA